VDVFEVDAEGVDFAPDVLEDVLVDPPLGFDESLLVACEIILIEQFVDLPPNFIRIVSQFRQGHGLDPLLLILADNLLDIFAFAPDSLHIIAHLEYILSDEDINTPRELFQLALEVTDDLPELTLQPLLVLLREGADL
jgi:hypothetical protein